LKHVSIKTLERAPSKFHVLEKLRDFLSNNTNPYPHVTRGR
jgi:hypothetical protein